MSFKLTGLDHDGHGCLLDDGAYPGEGGETAVVSPAVLLLGVGEVQVSVQTHGHPLVLLDVLQIWTYAEGGGKPFETRIRSYHLVGRDSIHPSAD